MTLNDYQKAAAALGKDEGLIRALKTLRVQTGSLACMGCGYEHNCGVHGCAILREAGERLREQDEELIQAQANAEHYKDERDRAVGQLRKLADCSTCRKEVPEGTDPPECACCLRGEKWEWDGGWKKHG